MEPTHHFYTDREFFISVAAVLVVGVFVIWFAFFRVPNEVAAPLTTEQKLELLNSLDSGTELSVEEKKSVLDQPIVNPGLEREEKMNILNALKKE